MKDRTPVMVLTLGGRPRVTTPLQLLPPLDRASVLWGCRVRLITSPSDDD